MEALSRTRPGSWIKSACAVLAVCLLALAAGEAVAMQIEVTEVNGTVRGLRQNATIQFPITVGTILFTCDRVFVHPNSSLKWKRRGAQCDNDGGALNSDQFHGMAYHVGEESVGPGAPAPYPTEGSAVLPGGFIDLETSLDAWTSQVTIEEGSGCTGVDHCGLNSSLAQAVAVDETPQGTTTVFTGCLSYTERGLPLVSFWTDLGNRVAVATTPMVGPHMGQIIPLGPGQNVIYDSEGNPTIGSGPLPCQGVEPPTASRSATWGAVKSHYR